jgi:hypothetical protein
MSLVKLQKAIQDMLETNTGLDVYDAVPQDAPTPLIYVEFAGKRDGSTKTSWREIFTYWIHGIAKEADSSVEVLDIATTIEEALTGRLTLPDGFDHMMTNEAGIVTHQKDPTGEKHIVLAYEFTVTYGFKCKV